MTRLVAVLLASLTMAGSLLVLVSALALPGVAGTVATVETTDPTSLLLFGTTLAAIGLLVRRKLRRVSRESST